MWYSRGNTPEHLKRGLIEQTARAQVLRMIRSWGCVAERLKGVRSTW